MKSRVAVAALFALVALTLAPAQADVPLWRLTCKASGTMIYVGDAEGGNVWLDLQASGTCSGYPGGPLSVTLTAGEVDAPYLAPGVCPASMRPKLTLRDPAGTSHVLWQSWSGDMVNCLHAKGLAAGVVRNVVGAPVGIWKWIIGPLDNVGLPQSIWMKWTFLVWPWV